jgi:hypothetical protein
MRPAKKSKFKSFKEVLDHYKLLENRSKRILYLLGYPSSDIIKTLRDFIQFTNSLSILLIQFELYSHALPLLRKAMKTDFNLFKVGDAKERLWQGRLVTYNNLAYVFFRAGDTHGALKFLYDTHSMTLALQNQNSKLAVDILLSTNFLTFLVLWSIGRKAEAKSYIEAGVQALNAVIMGQENSKLSHLSRINLYGIGGLCLSALKDDYAQSIQICEETLSQLKGENIAVSTLIKRCINRCRQKLVMKTSAADSHSRDPFIDILLSNEFIKILFTTTFTPFIGYRTPLIHPQELESLRLQSEPLSKYSLSEIINQFFIKSISNSGKKSTNKPGKRQINKPHSDSQDNYTVLMSSIVTRDILKNITPKSLPIKNPSNASSSRSKLSVESIRPQTKGSRRANRSIGSGEYVLKPPLCNSYLDDENMTKEAGLNPVSYQKIPVDSSIYRHKSNPRSFRSNDTSFPHIAKSSITPKCLAYSPTRKSSNLMVEFSPNQVMHIYEPDSSIDVSPIEIFEEEVSDVSMSEIYN